MIEVKDLVRSFKSGSSTLTVLKGISLKIREAEFVAVMGRSGAGKSTLLYQMGLLDHPTSGQVFLDGQDTTNLDTDARVEFRLKRLGYVFQDYALLPELTALENVSVVSLMQGLEKKKAYKRSAEALERVGLEHCLDKIPAQLSGGEQQRVSIARAIAHKPKILFADEPTANLDSETSLTVINIFKQLNKEGQTIVMVTHEDEYMRMVDRVIKLTDGVII